MLLDDLGITVCENGADRENSTRELILVVLEQLYICYDRLGCLQDAEPLLDQLAALAIDSGPVRATQ